jgi:type III restriction enzyme
MARLIERYLVKNDYSDNEERITEQYHQAKRGGILNLAALPEELEPYKEQILQLIESVFSATHLPEIDDDRKGNVNPLNANFQKREFQELWRRINQKAIYAVDFKASELIAKCVTTLDRELKVTPLQYTVIAGEQKEEAKYDDVTRGGSFVVRKTETDRLISSASSSVKYDLIGKIAESTQLTRKTIGAILRGINAAVFAQYKANPEDFILKSGTLINEQKATVIVEHLAYNPIEETYTSDIFTHEKKEDFTKGFKANRHIYDYVFTDSGNERTFVGELDASAEVVVYAKLPRSFYIPTPVGNYNPDWAIAFQAGKVKHVYFVAETKGSMSSMELRRIEGAKIDCARKFFAKITSGQVKYDVVDSYGKLMELVK